MQIRKFIPMVFALSLFIGACNKNESQAPVETQKDQKSPLTGDGKFMVAGCEGPNFNLSGAIDAFKKGDFYESNRQASCVFNQSVKNDPNHPDLKAANLAFLSKAALMTESDQIKYLLLTDLKATDLFGPAGDPEKLNTAIKNIIGTSDGYATFYRFLKAHEDKGHAPQAVFETFLTLVRERSVDLHILAKAMAADKNFSDEIPDYFINVPAAKSYKITQTEAAVLDYDLTAVRAMAEIFQFYYLGISSADSFQGSTDHDIAVKLAADLNTSPKFLELKGSSDGSKALPLFADFLDSAKRAVESISKNDVESWAKDLAEGFWLPKKTDTDYIQKLLLTLFQLKESLGGNEVQLTAFTDDKITVNVTSFFSPLPDSKNISEVTFKVDGDKIEPNETFLTNFSKGFLKVEP